MHSLGDEIRILHNPGLGAVLIWRFTSAFSRASANPTPVPLPLAFLVLPICWHAPTLCHAASTQAGSGMRAFAAKFSHARPSELDTLLALNDRAKRWRPKTYEAIKLGLATGLIRLGAPSNLSANDASWKIDHQLPSMRPMYMAAEKFGTWCANLTVNEISLILHVRF